VANAQVSEFVRSNNSFSGVDIKATFGNRTIGELQAISISVTREKAPIYTMGSADPRAFARGKRGIAGTLIFIMFDRDALLSELNNLLFQSDIDDIRPEYRVEDAEDQRLNAQVTSASQRTASSTIGANSLSGLTAQESDITTFVNEDQAPAIPWYADQIPGFDITLAAANEYGALAVMKIFGAEILNEGYGVSIDDIVSEKQYTYIARAMLNWQWVKPDDRFLRRV